MRSGRADVRRSKRSVPLTSTYLSGVPAHASSARGRFLVTNDWEWRDAEQFRSESSARRFVRREGKRDPRLRLRVWLRLEDGRDGTSSVRTSESVRFVPPSRIEGMWIGLTRKPFRPGRARFRSERPRGRAWWWPRSEIETEHGSVIGAQFGQHPDVDPDDRVVLWTTDWVIAVVESAHGGSGRMPESVMRLPRVPPREAMR